MTQTEKIHKEIDTAQDRLLTEAIEIINNHKIPENTLIESKADRLVTLGFVNSETVKKASEISSKRNVKLKEKQVSQELANLIKYYKEKYPLHKFLTAEELDRICNKYQLVYAPVDRYIKDIPEKNINDMFTMKKIEEKDTDTNYYKLVISIFWKDIPNNVKQWFNKSIFDESIVGKTEKQILSLCPIKHNSKYLWEGDASLEKTNKSGLFIAAPKSHFNLEGLHKEKLGFFEKLIIKPEPKDPIVFQYVKGGILVITKWGEEASDPLLLNEIFN